MAVLRADAALRTVPVRFVGRASANARVANFSARTGYVRARIVGNAVSVAVGTVSVGASAFFSCRTGLAFFTNAVPRVIGCIHRFVGCAAARACRRSRRTAVGNAFACVRVGLVARGAFRTAAVAASFTLVAVLCFARHARRTVQFVSRFARRAVIATRRLRTRRAVRRSADARCRIREFAPDFAAAVAVSDHPARAVARFARVAFHALSVVQTSVFAFVARIAVRIRRAGGFYAFVLIVDDIAVVACALRSDFAQNAYRVHRSAVRASVAFAVRRIELAAHFARACRVGVASDRYAVARSVGDFARGTVARRSPRAGIAIRVQRRRVFALVAFGAIRIRCAGVRSAAAFAVGNLPFGTRRFTARVVPRRARRAGAGRFVLLVARIANLVFQTDARAETVGHAFARAAALFAQIARFARTQVLAVLFRRRTRGFARAVTAAFSVKDLRPRAAALVAFRTRHAVRIHALQSRAARRIRAAAFRRMVFGDAFFAVGTRVRRTHRFALAVFAFLRVVAVGVCQTLRSRNAARIGVAVKIFAVFVPQFHTFRDSERCRVI